MTIKDKSSELRRIFAESGLSDVLEEAWTEYKPKEKRTKLQVHPNRWRLSSLELVEHGEEVYPRIHYQKDISEQFKSQLATAPGVSIRSRVLDHGISYAGDALTVARHLRSLLGGQVPEAPASRPVNAHPMAQALVPAVENVADARQAEVLELLRTIDQKILGFVAKQENRALQPRTRSYSTPFRGSLFQCVTQSEVARELSLRPAKVLILGANPNDSGEHHPEFRLKVRTLEEQAASGLFSEAYWDEHGKAQPGWNAAHKDNWQILFAPLRLAGVVEEEVAFANYLPWGSRTLSDFVATVEPALAARIIAFADELFDLVLLAVRPTIVIAPFSISEHLPGSVLALHRKVHPSQSFRFRSSEGTDPFNFHQGPLERGIVSTTVVHLRHPSSLRIGAEARSDIVDRLAVIPAAHFK